MTDSFLQTQYRFAAHIRDPATHAAPAGIEDRRMAIYRELFFNNINSALKQAFPVIHTLLAAEAWQALVRDFIKRHRCRSPLFHQLASEFIDYLQHERKARTDPSFLVELAHYEWVELALGIAEPAFRQTPLPAGQDCLSLSLHRSPLAWSLQYHYPVHRIGPGFLPQAPTDDPVCLLVYRDDEDRVRFLEINPVSARLLALLEAGFDGHAAAARIARELRHANEGLVRDSARTLIQDWLSRGIVLMQDRA